MSRWFEDFAAGEHVELGSRTLEAEEIMAFARAFDPQSFHVDPDAALKSPYGGLIASGWHTASTMIGILTRMFAVKGGFLVSAGYEDLRWLRPVRPGDTLTVSVDVLAVTPSRSKPDRGRVDLGVSAVNQTGAEVCRFVNRTIYLRRPMA